MADVTIFSDRARVTRRIPVHVMEGKQFIEFAELPDAVDDSSVRASGRGDGVRIIGLEVKRIHRAREKEGNVAELRNELQSLKDKESLLADAEQIEEGRRRFLEQVGRSGGRNLTRGLADGTTTIDALQNLSDFLATSMGVSCAISRETARRQRKLEKRINAVRRRLEEYGKYERLELRQIRIAVEADNECDVELEVTYDTRGASWTPHYELRLHDDRLELFYLATVHQTTGEGWEDVGLRLSTAPPRLSTHLPELDTWYVDRRDAPLVSVFDATVRSDMPMGGAQPAPAVMPPQSMSAVQAHLESEGAAVTYRIERPTTIPSDNTLVRVAIASIELSPTLDYLSIPSLDDRVYLRARVVNDSPHLLLPAEATIFHGSEYVGKAMLERIAPGGEFELQLGVDDRVTVERKLASRRASKSMTGSTKRIEFAYEITVGNHLPRTATISLQDQLPVSLHESIKIKPGDIDPAPQEMNDMGIITWKIDLPPGSREVIRFDFAVEHPRDLDIDIGM